MRALKPWSTTHALLVRLISGENRVFAIGFGTPVPPTPFKHWIVTIPNGVIAHPGGAGATGQGTLLPRGVSQAKKEHPGPGVPSGRMVQESDMLILFTGTVMAAISTRIRGQLGPKMPRGRITQLVKPLMINLLPGTDGQLRPSRPLRRMTQFGYPGMMILPLTNLGQPALTFPPAITEHPGKSTKPTDLPMFSGQLAPKIPPAPIWQLGKPGMRNVNSKTVAGPRFH